MQVYSEYISRYKIYHCQSYTGFFISVTSNISVSIIYSIQHLHISVSVFSLWDRSAIYQSQSSVSEIGLQVRNIQYISQQCISLNADNGLSNIHASYIQSNTPLQRSIKGVLQRTILSMHDSSTIMAQQEYFAVFTVCTRGSTIKNTTARISASHYPPGAANNLVIIITKPNPFFYNNNKTINQISLQHTLFLHW